MPSSRRSPATERSFVSSCGCWVRIRASRFASSVPPPEEIATILARLHRVDAAADTPWTARYLRLIAGQPATVARVLSGAGRRRGHPLQAARPAVEGARPHRKPRSGLPDARQERRSGARGTLTPHANATPTRAPTELDVVAARGYSSAVFRCSSISGASTVSFVSSRR